MPHQTLTDMLRDLDMFSSVPDDVLSELIGAGTTFTFRPGATVVTQGTSSAGLQVVLEGLAEVDVNGAHRGSIGPGQSFGEISVIDDRGRSATVTAGPDGLKTFAVSPLNFSRLLDEHPALTRSVLKALCGRIRSLEAAEFSTA